MVNNIKDNTISEIDAKKRLNTLNKIKNAEIKYKRLIPGQKELLNLFNDLSDIILTDKTLMSSKDENKKLKEENENENENEDEDDEMMRQNEIKELNDYLDEIDKSKSFEPNRIIKKSKKSRRALFYQPTILMIKKSQNLKYLN